MQGLPRFGAQDYPADRSVDVSIIIHTRNEALHLEHALASLRWAKHVFVVDSESTDDTQRIAREMGAHVVSRACTRVGLVEQRNWALETLPIISEWVLIVDADEIVEPSLAHEISSLLAEKPADKDAYQVRFKVYFLGKWIRYSSLYPTWSIRLFRRFVRYEPRAVNSHPLVPSERRGTLKNHLHHIDRRGIEAYVRRTIEFGSLEALEARRIRLEGERQGLLKGRFRGDPMERRRWLKNLYMRLPFHPFLAFLYIYFMRLGFLDGYPGFVFAAWRGFTELYTDAKRMELSPQMQTSVDNGRPSSP
jgi:glycosyltransferase involved in cell wall biosynthesis